MCSFGKANEWDSAGGGKKNLCADDFVKEKMGEVVRRLQAVTDKLTLVGEEGGDNIDILISKTRALISTNEEIWERCKQNEITQSRQPAGGQLRLYRVGYPKVTVTSSAVIGGHNRCVVVKTTSELEIKSFEPLPAIPNELLGFFHFASKSENDCSPFRFNHEDCLASIICTKDDIARHFSIILKAHLEQVQIALGEIERWLLDTEEDVQFINQIFKCNLSKPELGDGDSERRGPSLCVKCFEPYETHKKEPNMGLYHPDWCKSWCRAASHERGSYFVSSSHDLKKIEISSPTDIYQLTFDLCMDDDRGRLKRFLYLMEAPGSSV
mmetsp:Transcript_6237/g.9908  ORF Transcript_6237/g.9908 Transcript_6237/m.9908 type:complete len:325 (+) Transcript_6237:95-1069(+)